MPQPTGILRKVHFRSFKRGDDILEKVFHFSLNSKIKNANIIIMGGLQNATLRPISTSNKLLKPRKMNISMNIVSMIGNILLKRGKPFVKLHATLTKNNSDFIQGEILSPTKILEGQFIVFEKTAE